MNIYYYFFIVSIFFDTTTTILLRYNICKYLLFLPFSFRFENTIKNVLQRRYLKQTATIIRPVEITTNNYTNTFAPKFSDVLYVVFMQHNGTPNRCVHHKLLLYNFSRNTVPEFTRILSRSVRA